MTKHVADYGGAPSSREGKGGVPMSRSGPVEGDLELGGELAESVEIGHVPRDEKELLLGRLRSQHGIHQAFSALAFGEAQLSGHDPSQDCTPGLRIGRHRHDAASGNGGDQIFNSAKG